MKAIHAWVCAIASLLSLAVQADSANTIPSLIADPRSNTPAWVPAEVAVEDGRLKPELFGWYLENLRAVAQQNGEALKGRRTPSSDQADRPCSIFKGQPPSEDFVPKNTLEDLTRSGETIVVGRVVAIREGFWFGLPASLLQLDAAWLKGDSAAATFVVYPFAHIDTAEGPICSTPVGDFIPPQVGDRAVVFSNARPFTFDGGSVVADIPAGLVHERPGERPRVPASLRTLVPEHGSAVDVIRDATLLSLKPSRHR